MPSRNDVKIEQSLVIETDVQFLMEMATYAILNI